MTRLHQSSSFMELRRRGGDGLGNNTRGAVRLLRVNKQRWRKAYCRSAGAKHEQSAFETFRHDRVAQLRVVEAAIAVLDNIEAKHQSQASNISNHGMHVQQLLKA